jgi:hypothetical protein
MASRYPAAVSLAYHAIMRSDVFVLNGPPIDLPRALCLLGRALHKRELPEHIWGSLGEFGYACLGDLVIGAYWSCSEWLCSLGQVFSPGMTCFPEPDDSEFGAYELIGKWFSARAKS